jgi:hypothetical protein
MSAQLASKALLASAKPVIRGHIRAPGCRDLRVYCVSGHCNHSATMNANWMSDTVPVRSLCSRMVCTRCGLTRCAA